jgi:hypothetical protein
MKNHNPDHDVNSTSTICAIVLDSFGDPVDKANIILAKGIDTKPLANGTTDESGKVNIICPFDWDTITIKMPDFNQDDNNRHKK